MKKKKQKKTMWEKTNKHQIPLWNAFRLSCSFCRAKRNFTRYEFPVSNLT